MREIILKSIKRVKKFLIAATLLLAINLAANGRADLIGAALIGFLFALFALRSPEYLWKLPIIGGVSSIISQIGDLAASAIKRNHDIKDYGKLIPGHGGILDRFDSIIFIAPIVYYLVVFLGL